MERTSSSRAATTDPGEANRVRSRRPIRTERRFLRPSNRLRLVFFSLASLWGFLLGIAFLGGIAALQQRPIALDPQFAGVLIPGALLAIVGAAVVAQAYRESRRRRR